MIKGNWWVHEVWKKTVSESARAVWCCQQSTMGRICEIGKSFKPEASERERGGWEWCIWWTDMYKSTSWQEWLGWDWTGGIICLLIYLVSLLNKLHTMSTVNKGHQMDGKSTGLRQSAIWSSAIIFSIIKNMCWIKCKKYNKHSQRSKTHYVSSK